MAKNNKIAAVKLSVRERIEAGEYNPTVARPDRKNFEHAETFKPKFGQSKTHVSFDQDGYDAARKAYYADCSTRSEQFKLDVIAEVGLTGHPKAEACWRLADEEGHSAGLEEIVSWMERLSELVL